MRIVLKVFKIFGFLLAGFSGGCLAPWFLTWIHKVSIDTASDAVAIANTYIVFTTIIFVGFTVVLGVAGYFFTQQFSTTKETEQLEVFKQLKEKLRGDEQTGIDLLNSLLDNPDVKVHIVEILQAKVDELIDSRLADSEAYASQAAQERDLLTGIAAQIKNGNKKV